MASLIRPANDPGRPAADPWRVRVVRALPHMVLLTLALWFYRVAAKIEFDQIPDQVGPDAWPRGILALLILVCVWQVVRALFFRPRPPDSTAIPSDAGLTEAISDEIPKTPAGPRSAAVLFTGSPRVWAGIAATFAYLAAFNWLGFFIATSLYLVALMRIGGYRRWPRLVPLALLYTLVFMVLFTRVVYVSLPLGVEPFNGLSILLIKLMGV